MASNPYKNKIIYDGDVLMDLSSDTVTPENLTEGFTAHDRSGAPIVGTAPRAAMEEITWAALKAKRDGGTLDKGRQYRITDYVCTTTQERSRAVAHPFDVIVFADDESTLNENVRACLHEGSTITAFDGSVTIEAGEGVPIISTNLNAALPYAESIKVTYDGTEYSVPVYVPDGSFLYYFGEFDDSTEEPVYTNFPFAIVPDNDDDNRPIWRFDVPSSAIGTHTLKIEYEVDPDYYTGKVITTAFDSQVLLDVAAGNTFCIGYLPNADWPLKSGALSGVRALPDSITVTYDGTDYVLPFSGYKEGYDSVNDDGVYGGFDETGPIFNDYPLCITAPLSPGFAITVYTPLSAEGEHTLKIEGDFGQGTRSALEAWELKYCLDNDNKRFDWVDTNGRGVIYYMKDDHDNECPYDFKQIQFLRFQVESAPSDMSFLSGLYFAYLVSEDIDGVTMADGITWFYTFSTQEGGGSSPTPGPVLNSASPSLRAAGAASEEFIDASVLGIAVRNVIGPFWEISSSGGGGPDPIG